MGLYIYLNEQDIKRFSRVDDAELDEVFQEAKRCDKSLLISTFTRWHKKKWWKSVREITEMYQIYHQQYIRDGVPAMEARQMICACGKKELVMAYLYGIINGVNSKELNTYKS